MSENPPEYDPQSNGNAEVGVQLLKGHLRTMRSSLEEQLGYRVPARHPLVAWLVQHAADVLTWTIKGHDGQTAYQRVRSKPFVTRLMAFGEMCRFKNRSHEPLSNTSDGRRFHLGAFIGIDRRTGQYMLHDGTEIKLARTVMRLPDANKWDRTELAKIAATPWDVHQPRAQEVVFRDQIDPVPVDLANKVIIARNVYIKDSDLDAYGMTRGCPKCDAKTVSYTHLTLPTKDGG